MQLIKRIILGLSVGLILGFIIGKLFFGNTESPSKKDEAEEVEVHQEWTCSMHPQIRRSEPGTCPICGMDLIPVSSSGSSRGDELAVSMTPTAMKLANVQTMVVGDDAGQKSVALAGKVQEDERGVSTQSAHFAGRVERLLVNFTGEQVRKGQVLAYLYSPELVTAQEELLEAAKVGNSQPQLLKSARQKLKNWKLTERQIDQIIGKNEVQSAFPIYSDISGVVEEKLVNTGDYVKQGQGIFRVANLSQVWVLFDVYESDLEWVKEGTSVKYTVRSLPGKSFEGRVAYIDPVIDPQTRVAKARVEASNSDGLLKPEMFVSGKVKVTSLDKSTLTIPKSAVMWTGKRSVVYVASQNDSGMNFQMQEITLGQAMDDRYEVLDGLEAGVEIVVNGTFSVDAAAELAGKPSMMNRPDKLEQRDEMLTSNNSSQNVKAALQPVFEAYMLLKDALVSDAFEAAKTAASEMNEHLKEVKMEVFTSEGHKVWMSNLPTLKANSMAIAESAGLEEVRSAFQQVSNSMITIAKTFHPTEGTIYVQHCPMADDYKGADWLSLDKEIKNPYFGTAMLSCGEVTDIIH